MKRSLLAVAVTALSIQTAYAAPFMPMDARGLAMGNTGVASAKLAHAPAYNPSLLSQAGEKDDFAFLFPQLGLNLADQEEMIDQAEKISDDIFPRFENIVSSGNGDDLSSKVDQLISAIEALENTINSMGTIDDNNIQTKLSELRTRNQAINNATNNIQTSLGDLNSATGDLQKSLGGMSGSPLSAKLGVGGALAIPSKKFAAAISFSGSANISALANFTQNDIDLLGAYVPAAQGYVGEAQDFTSYMDDTLGSIETAAAGDPVQAALDLQGQLNNLKSSALTLKDFSSDSVGALDGSSVIKNGKVSSEAENPNLSSTLQLVAVATVDLGISFAREFDFGGEKVAIGITPKLQKVSTFHYADEIDGFDEVDEDTLTDSQLDYTHFNLDIGASYRFGSGGNWMVGLVGKNLLGGSFDYKDVEVTPRNSDGIQTGATYTIDGGAVKMNPQFRGGLAYQSRWVNVALDVDLTENKPVAFEAPTQFAAIGVELDVFRTLQLRAGFRTNLADSGTNIASVGLGFSPFGVHIDIAAMANIDKPEKEAGVAFETGFYF